MTLLQRYMLKELVPPLLMGLIVFTFVFLVGQLFQIAHLLFSSGAAGMLAIQLIGCMVPGVLSLTIPMGLLVAVLLAVGRLAADREILAIRASGIHLRHIMAPLVVAGALLSGTMVWLNLDVIPALNLKSADLALQLEFRILSALPANRPLPISSADDKNQRTTFFFNERDQTTGDMLGVTVRTELQRNQSQSESDKLKAVEKQIAVVSRKSDSSAAATTMSAELLELYSVREELLRKRAAYETLIIAARGIMEADMINRMIIMRLTSGTLQLVSRDQPSSPWNVRFSSLQKGYRPQFEQTSKGYFRKRPREQSISELLDGTASGRTANLARVEFYQRLFVPLACLAMPLAAFPLGLWIRPKGKTMAYAVAFLVILVYYGLLNAGISVGRSGSPWTAFAMFLPNAAVGLFGAILSWWTMWR